MSRRVWRLRRNCSASPAALAAALMLPLLVTSAASVLFWLDGYPLIAPFVALERLVAAAALVGYARHAHDGETVTLEGDSLLIDRQAGTRRDTLRLNAVWVRLPARRRGERGVDCAYGRERWPLARNVDPAEREAFAAELAAALGQLRPPRIVSGAAAVGTHDGASACP